MIYSKYLQSNYDCPHESITYSKNFPWLEKYRNREYFMVSPSQAEDTYGQFTNEIVLLVLCRNIQQQRLEAKKIHKKLGKLMVHL